MKELYWKKTFNSNAKEKTFKTLKKTIKETQTSIYKISIKLEWTNEKKLKFFAHIPSYKTYTKNK